MSNIDKRALREEANAANAASWGYWESYKPHKGARGYEVKVGVKAVAQHCLKVDSVFIAAAAPATVLALLDELEAAQSENERLAKMLTERNGEPVEELVKRVAELEEIATDYGMKFQRAQDALKHQSLLHKTQIEAAEKRIADYQARLDRIERRCDHHGSVYWDVSNVKRCAKCGMAIIESANGATS